MRIYALTPMVGAGQDNMSWDEALLEWVRQQVAPMLLLRCYAWEAPTLSLGVNQPVRDLQFLERFYAGATQAPQELVRRPTGGRAILHGEDVSYALVSNEPDMLKRPLKEAYEIYAGYVQAALQALALSVMFAEQKAPTGQSYTRSPVCFETHTPTDLVDGLGKKLSGSAQLRRQGGLLQHGAVFAKGQGVSLATLHAALASQIEADYTQPAETLPNSALREVEAIRQELLHTVGYRLDCGK